VLQHLRKDCLPDLYDVIRGRGPNLAECSQKGTYMRRNHRKLLTNRTK
jgi:hypothetical protein